MGRYVKILLTVVAALTCFVISLLWWRSYRTSDMLYFSYSEPGFAIGSTYGVISVGASDYHLLPRGPSWHIGSSPIVNEPPKFSWDAPFTTGVDCMFYRFDPSLFQHKPWGKETYGFTAGYNRPGSWSVSLPHSLPVLITASIAVVPWINWSQRFRLKAFMIAVTLIAILLGVIVSSN